MGRHKPMRVYADTSVFGGIQDAIFERASKAFFEQVQEERFQLVVSALVARELRAAPEPVRLFFEAQLPNVEVIHDATPAVELQQAYLRAGVVTPNWADDALHVAFATVSECAVIVSWNFKHIVNLRRISLYNGVNMQQGYRPIEIRSPIEVLDDDASTS